MPAFIDTWGWIAICDQTVREYEKASTFFFSRFEAGGRFATSNFVLAETITLAFSRYGENLGERFLDRILDLLQMASFRYEEVTPERFEKTLEFRRRYRDKPKISFTDLTSMVVMRELGITEIVTADRHFEQVNLGFRIVPGR